MRLETLIQDITGAVYRKIMENRTVEEGDARETAKVVALSAIKYGDLSNQASKDYVFDVDRFTSFEGNTGPYILYTIVRIKSIQNRYSQLEGRREPVLRGCESSCEKELQMELARVSEVLEAACQEMAPHKICQYIYDLANGLNKFYHETKIIAEEDQEKQAGYMGLIGLTRTVLETCIGLLGFQAPDRM